MSEPPAQPATENGAPAQETAEVSWDDLGMSPAEAKKAIAESQKWEKRSKDNFAKLKEAEPKLSDYDRMVEANKTVEQRQADQLAKAQTEADTWRKTAVGSRIETIASVDFADPSDAVGQLNAADYLGSDGQIDDARIREDLADLLARKPHWKRADSPVTRAPGPNPAQGAGGNPPASGSEFMNQQLRRAAGRA